MGTRRSRRGPSESPSSSKHRDQRSAPAEERTPLAIRASAQFLSAEPGSPDSVNRLSWRFLRRVRWSGVRSSLTAARTTPQASRSQPTWKTRERSSAATSLTWPGSASTTTRWRDSGRTVSCSRAVRTVSRSPRGSARKTVTTAAHASNWE